MSHFNLRKKIGLWAMIGSATTPSDLQANVTYFSTKRESVNLTSSPLLLRYAIRGDYEANPFIYSSLYIDGSYETNYALYLNSFKQYGDPLENYTLDFGYESPRYNPSSFDTHMRVQNTMKSGDGGEAGAGPSGLVIQLPTAQRGTLHAMKENPRLTVKFTSSADNDYNFGSNVITLISDQARDDGTGVARRRSLVVGLDRDASQSSAFRNIDLDFEDRALDLRSRAYYDKDGDYNFMIGMVPYGVKSAVIGSLRMYTDDDWNSANVTYPNFKLLGIGKGSRMESAAMSCLRMRQTGTNYRNLSCATVFGEPELKVKGTRINEITHSINKLGVDSEYFDNTNIPKKLNFRSLALVQNSDNGKQCAAATIFGPAVMSLLESTSPRSAYYRMELKNIGNDVLLNSFAEMHHDSEAAAPSAANANCGLAACAVLGPAHMAEGGANGTSYDSFFKNWEFEFRGNATITALAYNSKSAASTTNGSGIKINAIGGDSNRDFRVNFNDIASSSNPLINILAASCSDRPQKLSDNSLRFSLKPNQNDNNGRPIRAIGLGNSFTMDVGGTTDSHATPGNRMGTINLIGAIGKADNSGNTNDSKMYIRNGWTVNAWRPIADLQNIILESGKLRLQQSNTEDRQNLNKIFTNEISPNVSYRIWENQNYFVRDQDLYGYGAPSGQTLIITGDEYPIDGRIDLKAATDQIIFHVDSTRPDISNANFKLAKGYIEVTDLTSSKPFLTIEGTPAESSKKPFKIVNDAAQEVALGSTFQLIRVLQGTSTKLDPAIKSEMTLGEAMLAIDGMDLYPITNSKNFLEVDDPSQWKVPTLYWMSGGNTSALVVRNVEGEIIRGQGLGIKTYDSTGSYTRIKFTAEKSGTLLSDGTYNSTNSLYCGNYGALKAITTKEKCGIYCYSSSAGSNILIEGFGKDTTPQLDVRPTAASTSNFSVSGYPAFYINGSGKNQGTIKLSDFNIYLQAIPGDDSAYGIKDGGSGKLTVNKSTITVESENSGSNKPVLFGINSNGGAALDILGSDIKVSLKGKGELHGIYDTYNPSGNEISITDSKISLVQTASDEGYLYGAVHLAVNRPIFSHNGLYHISTETTVPDTRALKLSSNTAFFDGGGVFSESSRYYIYGPASELSNLANLNINCGTDFGSGDKNFYSTSINFAKNFSISGNDSSIKLGKSGGNVYIAALVNGDNSAVALDLSGISLKAAPDPFEIGGSTNYFVGLNGTLSNRNFTAASPQNSGNASVILPSQATLQINANSTANFIGGIKASSSASQEVHVIGPTNLYGTSSGIQTWKLSGPLTLKAGGATLNLPTRHPTDNTAFTLKNLPAGWLDANIGTRMIFDISPDNSESFDSTFAKTVGYVTVEPGGTMLDLRGKILLSTPSGKTTVDSDKLFWLVRRNTTGTDMASVLGSTMTRDATAKTQGSYSLYRISNGSNFLVKDAGFLDPEWLELYWMSGNNRSGLVARALAAEVLRTTGLSITPTSGTATVHFGTERKGTALRDGVHLTSGEGYLKSLVTTEKCGIYCNGASGTTININGSGPTVSPQIKITADNNSTTNLPGITEIAGIQTSGSNFSPINIKDLRIEVLSTATNQGTCGIKNGEGKLNIEGTTITVNSANWGNGIYNASYSSVSIRNSTISYVNLPGLSGHVLSSTGGLNSVNGLYFGTNSFGVSSTAGGVTTYDGGGLFGETSNYLAWFNGVSRLDINRGTDFGTGDKNFYSTAINYGNNFILSGMNPSLLLGKSDGDVSIASLVLGDNSAIGIELSGVRFGGDRSPVEIAGRTNYYVGINGSLSGRTFTTASAQHASNAAINLPANAVLDIKAGTTSHFVGGIKSSRTPKPTVQIGGVTNLYGSSSGVGTWDLSAPLKLAGQGSTLALPTRHPTDTTPFNLTGLPAGQLALASDEKIIFHIDPTATESFDSTFSKTLGYIELGTGANLDLKGKIGLKAGDLREIGDDKSFWLVRRNTTGTDLASALGSSLVSDATAQTQGSYSFYRITNGSSFLTEDAGLLDSKLLELYWMSGAGRSGLIAKSLPAEILRTTGLSITPTSGTATVHFGTERKGTALRDGVHLTDGEGYLKSLISTERCGFYCNGASGTTININWSGQKVSPQIKITANGNSTTNLPNISYVSGIYMPSTNQAPINIADLHLEVNGQSQSAYGIYNGGQGALNIQRSSIKVCGGTAGIYDVSRSIILTIKDSTISLAPTENNTLEYSPLGILGKTLNSINCLYYLTGNGNRVFNLNYGNVDLNGGGYFTENSRSISAYASIFWGIDSIKINQGTDFGSGDKNFYSTSINNNRNLNAVGKISTILLGKSDGDVSMAALVSGNSSAIGVDLSPATLGSAIQIGGATNYYVGLNGTLSNRNFTAASPQHADGAAVRLPANAVLDIKANTTSHFVGGIRSVATPKPTVRVGGVTNLYGSSSGIGTWDLSDGLKLAGSGSKLSLPTRHPTDTTAFNLTGLPAGQISLASNEKIIFHIDPTATESFDSTFSKTLGYIELGTGANLDLKGKIGLKAGDLREIGGDKSFWLVRRNTTGTDLASALGSSLVSDATAQTQGAYSLYRITNGSSFLDSDAGLLDSGLLELYWMSGAGRSGLIAKSLPAEILRTTGLSITPTSGTATVHFGTERKGTALLDGVHLSNGEGYLKSLITDESCGCYCYGPSAGTIININGSGPTLSPQIKITADGNSTTKFHDVRHIEGISIGPSNCAPTNITNLSVEVLSTDFSRGVYGIHNVEKAALNIEKTAIRIDTNFNTTSDQEIDAINSTASGGLTLKDCSLEMHDSGYGLIRGIHQSGSMSPYLTIEDSTVSLVQQSDSGEVVASSYGAVYCTTDGLFTSCNGRYYLKTQSRSQPYLLYFYGGSQVFDGGGCFTESLNNQSSYGAVQFESSKSLNINQGTKFGSGDTNFYSTAINHSNNFTLIGSIPTIRIGKNNGNVSMAALVLANRQAVGLDLSDAEIGSPVEIAGRTNYYVGVNGTLRNRNFTAASQQHADSAAFKLPASAILDIKAGTTSHLVGGIKSVRTPKPTVRMGGVTNLYGSSSGVGTWDLSAPLKLAGQGSTLALPTRHPTDTTPFNLTGLPAGQLALASDEKIIFHIDPTATESFDSTFSKTLGYIELGTGANLDLKGKIGLKAGDLREIGDDKSFWLVRRNTTGTDLASALGSSLVSDATAQTQGAYSLYRITNGSSFLTEDAGLLDSKLLELYWMSGDGRSGLIAKSLPAEILRTTGLSIRPTSGTATVHFGTERKGTALQDGVHLNSGDGYLKSLVTEEHCGLYCYGSSGNAIKIIGKGKNIGGLDVKLNITSASKDPFQLGSATAGIQVQQLASPPANETASLQISNLSLEIASSIGRDLYGLRYGSGNDGQAIAIDNSKFTISKTLEGGVVYGISVGGPLTITGSDITLNDRGGTSTLQLVNVTGNGPCELSNSTFTIDQSQASAGAGIPRYLIHGEGGLNSQGCSFSLSTFASSPSIHTIGMANGNVTMVGDSIWSQAKGSTVGSSAVRIDDSPKIAIAGTADNNFYSSASNFEKNFEITGATTSIKMGSGSLDDGIHIGAFAAPTAAVTAIDLSAVSSPHLTFDLVGQQNHIVALAGTEATQTFTAAAPNSASAIRLCAGAILNLGKTRADGGASEMTIVGGITCGQSEKKPTVNVRGSSTKFWGLSHGIGTWNLSGPLTLESNERMNFTRREGDTLSLAKLPLGTLRLGDGEKIVFHINPDQNDETMAGFGKTTGYLTLTATETKQLILPDSHHGTFAIQTDGGEIPEKTPYYLVRIDGKWTSVGEAIDSEMQLSGRSSTKLINGFTTCKIANGTDFISTGNGYTSWDNLELYWIYNDSKSGLVARSKSATPPGTTTRTETLFLSHAAESAITFGGPVADENAEELLDGDFNSAASAFAGEGFLFNIANPRTAITVLASQSQKPNPIRLLLPVTTSITARATGILVEPGSHGDITLRGQQNGEEEIIRIDGTDSNGDMCAIECVNVGSGSLTVDGVSIGLQNGTTTITDRICGISADESSIPILLKNSTIRISNGAASASGQQKVCGISIDGGANKFDLVGTAINLTSSASLGNVYGLSAEGQTAQRQILIDENSSISAAIESNQSTGSVFGILADQSANELKLSGSVTVSSASQTGGAMVYGISAANFTNSIFLAGDIRATATTSTSDVCGVFIDDGHGNLTLTNGAVTAENDGSGSATALSAATAAGDLTIENTPLRSCGAADQNHEVIGLELSSFLGKAALRGTQIYAGNLGDGPTYGLRATAINLGSTFEFSNRENRDDIVQIVAENRGSGGSSTGIFMNENEAEVSVFNADQPIALNFLPLGNGPSTLDTTILSIGVTSAQAVEMGRNSLLQLGGSRNNIVAITAAGSATLGLGGGADMVPAIAATDRQSDMRAVVLRGGGIAIGSKTHGSINNIVGGIAGKASGEKPIVLLRGKETNLWGTSNNLATLECAGPVILKSAGTDLTLPIRNAAGTISNVTFTGLPAGKIEIAANDVLAIHIDSSTEDPANPGFKNVPGHIVLESTAEPQLILNGKIALIDDSVLGNSLANTNYWIIRGPGGSDLQLSNVIRSTMTLGSTPMTIENIDLLEVENAATFITTASPYSSWDGLKLYWFANSSASGLVVGSARPKGLTGIYVEDSGSTAADVYGVNAYRSLGGSELKPKVNITVFGRCSTSENREGYSGIVAGYYAPHATGTMSFSSHIRAENNNPSANEETAVFGVDLDGTHNDSVKFMAAKNRDSDSGDDLASISAIHRGHGQAYGIALREIASGQITFNGEGTFRVFAQAQQGSATALSLATKTLTKLSLGTVETAAPTDQLIFTALAPMAQQATALSAKIDSNINRLTSVSSLTPNLYLIGLSGNLALDDTSQQFSFFASPEGANASGGENQAGTAIALTDLTALTLGDRTDLICNHYLIGGMRGISGENGKPAVTFHGDTHIWGRCQSFSLLDLRGDVHLKTTISKSIDRAIPWGVTQNPLPVTLNNLPTGKIILSAGEALQFHIEHQGDADLVLGKLILEESDTGQRSELIFDASRPGKIRVTSETGSLLGPDLDLCLVEVRDPSGLLDTTAVIHGLETDAGDSSAATLLKIANEDAVFDNRINDYVRRNDLHLRLSNRPGLKGLFLMTSDPVVLPTSARTQPFFVTTKNNSLQIKFGLGGEGLPVSTAYASPDAAFTEAQKYFTRLIASDTSGIKIVDSATGRTVKIIASGSGPNIDAVRFSDGETLIGVDACRCLSQLIFEFEPQLVESLLLSPQTPKLLRESVELADLSSLRTIAGRCNGDGGRTTMLAGGHRTAKLGASQDHAFLRATDYARRFINTELMVSNMTAIAMVQNALRSSLEHLEAGNYAAVASLAAHSYQRELDGFGYHNDLFGFTIQGQHSFDLPFNRRRHFSLGSVGGYVNGKMNCFGKLEANGKMARQDMYFGGLVGAFQHLDSQGRRTNVNLFAGGMFGHNRLWRRDAEQKSFTAKYQNRNAFANLEALQTLCQLSPWDIDLWIGLNYHYAHQRGYQENPTKKGSAILSPIHSSTLGLIGGLNFERTILENRQSIGMTRVNFRLGLLAQAIRRVSSVTAIAEIRDVGIGSFTPRLTRRDRYAFLTNAGIRNRLTRNWQVELGWEGNFSKNYVYNNLSANLGYYF